MDTWINPESQDYELTGQQLTTDPANGLANAVYIRLMTPLGSYWRDAAMGSRLHELQREKDVPRVQILAIQYSQDALQPILDDGRATKIEISSEQPHNSRMNLLIEVWDAAGQKQTFKHPVKVL